MNLFGVYEKIELTQILNLEAGVLLQARTIIGGDVTSQISHPEELLVRVKGQR